MDGNDRETEKRERERERVRRKGNLCNLGN